MKTKNKADIKRIKILCVNNDLSIAQLARLIGKSRTWTSQVLYGHERSKKTQEDIASALSVSVRDLWPDSKRKAT